MKKLLLYTNSFKPLSIPFAVDPYSVSYSGNVEGYPPADLKSFCFIGFTLEDSSKLQETVEHIKSKFNLNRDNCNIDDYITVNEEKARIRIKCYPGSAGWYDGIAFSFLD